MEYRLRHPERRHPRHSRHRPIQERTRRLLRLRTHQRQIRTHAIFHLEDHLRHRTVRTSLLRRWRKDLGGELDQQIHPCNRKNDEVRTHKNPQNRISEPLLENRITEPPVLLLLVLLLSSRRDLLLSLSFAFSFVVITPGTGRKKIKLKSAVCFSPPKNTPSPHHVYHAFHHNFTTKKPHPKHPFPQTPLKSAHKSALIPRRNH